MATLNLVPNPPVLATQAVIFLVNIFVIKKLFLEPYLKVRDKRDQLTVGSKEAAEKALRDSDAVSNAIAEKLHAASLSSKSERESIRQVALTKRQALLAEAEAQAKAAVAKVEQQIKEELSTEKTKIPEIVKQLTEDVYQIALS